MNTAHKRKPNRNWYGVDTIVQTVLVCGDGEVAAYRKLMDHIKIAHKGTLTFTNAGTYLNHRRIQVLQNGSTIAEYAVVPAVTYRARDDNAAT